MIYKTLDDVKRVIHSAKPVAVVLSFWESYQAGLQYSAWFESKHQEYLMLWPETETNPMLDENGDPMLDDNGETLTAESPIDYSDNADYIAFDDWMQEREVLTGTRTVYDDQGNEAHESYEYGGDLIRQFVPDSSLYEPLESSELYRDFKKHIGLEYNGVLVPLGKDTQDTTTALVVAFQSGLTETNFHFENGNKLHLTAEAFPAFSAWVMQQRAGMFL